MAQIVVEEVLAYTVYGKGLVDILSRFAGEKIDRVREVNKTFLEFPQIFTALLISPIPKQVSSQKTPKYIRNHFPFLIR